MGLYLAHVSRLRLDASVQDKTIPQRTDSHQEICTLMAAYLRTKYADCLGLQSTSMHKTF